MPEMDTSTKMAFLLIRPRIVAAQEKYAAKVEANRENGKKGGRPAKPVEDDKINPEEPSEKPKNPTVFFENPTDNPKTHNIRQCSHETEAHKKMHLICIAARNDAVFFAYLVATPLHRFKCKKAFSTR